MSVAYAFVSRNKWISETLVASARSALRIAVGTTDSSIDIYHVNVMRIYIGILISCKSTNMYEEAVCYCIGSFVTDKPVFFAFGEPFY